MVKFSIRHMDKFVGLFVLAGTLALVFMLVFVGINKRWFERDLEYKSYFATAEGLSPGLELDLRGFAIGRVKSVTLLEDTRENDQVQLILTIYNQHAHRIVEGSVISLAVSPMGFGSSLVLYPGLDSQQVLPDGSVIPSSDSPHGQELLARGLVDRPKGRDEVTRLLATLPPLLTKVDNFMVTLDSVTTHLDRHLMGPRGIPGTGLMGTVNTTLLTTDQTIRDFAPTLARLDSLAAHMNQTMVGVNRLLNAPEGMIPALVGSEGSAAQLFQDEAQLYGNMLQIMEELRLMMNFLNQSTPEISALMEESTSAIVESEKLMQGLQNNPLVRGGIPPAVESNALFEGHRQEVR
jgi:phospholipid/cholesterol/gamma-HCH transport system substrate-binding protein